jgi:GTPase
LLYDALEGVDLLLAIVDASTSFGSGDQFVIELLQKQKIPTFLLLNKVDLIQKQNLLPLMSFYSGKYSFAEIVPISALKKDNLDLLLQLILEHLPAGPSYFPEDQFTDKHERFLVAELVREKVLRHAREELPFSIAVSVNRFQERSDAFVFLACDIVVEKQSQRKIVIGSHGQMLKQIGTEARADIENLLGKRVYLELFVKVQLDWRNDPTFLDSIDINRPV